ncbi:MULTISPECIES: PD-(D/E)XK nuclease family protein [Leuconostoc]|uniref:PD-(D/E)XK nuclease family protein n=1 Tax=Leuconostoc TaxID=1243 RepID=UPI0004614DDB|nr:MULTISPECIES: PD-(D/E)XK nuclease family protein [Leuconostoc]KDA49968.1 ATP-dependent nuclease, subunit B [Leuconostoc pseudomesenteroides PS12]OQJ75158.1 ATP-dependent helicase [Leuconostoc pseudomesenteroides]MDG9744164.1 exodeoxyribonuclease V subunit gamma [Leuconostoc falkenbergense]ORI54251.1 ATP-dependent helicase [Leuconostoc pseudomesenteroides]ORI60165.1 ATP-dependent helicase [Leuconostoc pseudomesenteroides]
MTLNILMGRAEHDMRGDMLVDIQKHLQKNASLTIYYIVPNHVKFDSEVDVLQRFSVINGHSQAQRYSQSRLQVYSLTRLAWALMKNTPTKQPETVSTAGLFMLVTDILREKASQLPVFARLQAKSGFVTALVAQLIELRVSRISPQDLLDIVAKSADNIFLRQTLNAKLRDLAIVAEAFEQKLGQQRITAQESLLHFVGELNDLELSNTMFYFDGFNGFTSAEQAVVNALIARYPVTIALLGDISKLGTQQAGDVFFKPMTTAQQLIAWASSNQQSVNTRSASTLRKLSSANYQVLSAWEKLGEYRSFQVTDDKTAFKAFVAETPIVEIQEVARRIRRALQQDPSLHLRDILILARDLGPYQSHIPAVMAAFELPFFLDTDVTMMNHPLVELILTLLSPQKFNYQNVLAILKTGLLCPTIDGKSVASDEFFDIVGYLDNYLYAYRPYESTWRRFDRPFQLFQVTRDNDETEISQDQKINQRLEFLRRFVVKSFDQLDDGLKKATTFRQAATALIEWLQKNHVVDVLINQRDNLMAQGDLVHAQQHDEVWQMFSQTLDDMVSFKGDDDFVLTDMVDILVAGFSGAKFSGIPNSLDQLTISEAGIVQSTSYRELFFIGGTRQNLPAQTKTTALINDAERTMVMPDLQSGDQPRYLQNTAQQQMAEENLLFYGSLMSATDHITLSYPILDSSGQIAEMSPFFKRLVDTFSIEVITVSGQPVSSSVLIKHYIGTPQTTLSELVKILPVARQTSAFKSLKSLLETTVKSRLTRVFSAPNYQNKPVQLCPEFVAALFGEQLNVSISQLESYYHNPYAYFLQYGLHLKERTTNTLDVAQTGTLYHAIFEKVLAHLIQNNLSLRDLTSDDIKHLVSEQMGQLMTSPVFEILTENGKMRATSEYLTRVSDILLLNLQAAARENTSRPLAVEQLFGFPKASLPALQLPKIHVRGKLDRLDLQDSAGEFGTIIDYKSNGKLFSWAQAYDGLQMQLLTYWDAAQQSANQLGFDKVGGAFFAKIVPDKTSLTSSTDIDALLEGRILPENFKYRGLFISDSAYVDALADIEPSEKSPHYPLARLKNGDLGKSGVDAVSPEEFEALLKRNRQNIVTAGQQILAGHFPLSPVEGGLTYSPYLDIMRFDRALGDRYREQTTGDKNRILELLKDEDE